MKFQVIGLVLSLAYTNCLAQTPVNSTSSEMEAITRIVEHVQEFEDLINRDLQSLAEQAVVPAIQRYDVEGHPADPIGETLAEMLAPGVGIADPKERGIAIFDAHIGRMLDRIERQEGPTARTRAEQALLRTPLFEALKNEKEILEPAPSTPPTATIEREPSLREILGPRDPIEKLERPEVMREVIPLEGWMREFIEKVKP